MFERRVKVILLLLAIAFVIMVGRLVDLQLIHADRYREQAAAALLLQPQRLPFVRGRILDRTGRPLATDEPSWDIRIDYGVLAMDEKYLHARAQRLRKSGRYGAGLSTAEVEVHLRREIDEMWRRLAHFSGEPHSELAGKKDEICERVSRIRRAHGRRHGFEERIKEETWAHPIVTGLDDQQQIAARRHFKNEPNYPWLEVEAASKRRFHDAECLAHVLGRTGNVDARQIERDPYRDDPLRRYKADETVGVTGVECAAEDLLRGRRGSFQRDRKGNVLEDIAPQAGQDVHLTLRFDLQQRLYELMAARLPALPHSPGGSIVVLDVASRDVLAMVSYPAYDPNRLLDRETYHELRRDTVRMPLRFRCASNHYPPGSIVKPLTCLAGLATGKIDLNSRFECSGYLFPENPAAGASKCWQASGSSRRMAHGPINAVEALEGSCNIFMYRVGSMLGVDSLCSFFGMVGFGERSGAGLAEESKGINPTPSYLNVKLGRRVERGDARLFAIGQGAVSVTPIQAANLMATYATGTRRHVRLIQEFEDDRQWRLPSSSSHLAAIREGLYRVVNSSAGTAYKYARLIDDRFALCGKTGSATKEWMAVAYKVPYTDGDGREMFTVLPANSRREALDEFKRQYPGATSDDSGVTAHERYPPHPPAGGGKHAHAWFAGYLQRIDAAGRPRYEVTPQVAFAVLVEFGGSGGRASGPIAKEVARVLIDVLGDELDPDAPVQQLQVVQSP